jgi:hypothetical protein
MQDLPQASKVKEYRPARDPAVRALIVAGLLIAFGAWCIIEVSGGKYPYVPLEQDINKFFGWVTNFFGQFVFTGAGAAFVVWTLSYLRRRVVADEQGIAIGGRRVAWSDVREVDARLLKHKDLLVIRAAGGDLTLRGWQIKGFIDLVAVIDASVPREKVVRG